MAAEGAAAAEGAETTSSAASRRTDGSSPTPPQVSGRAATATASCSKGTQGAGFADRTTAADRMSLGVRTEAHAWPRRKTRTVTRVSVPRGGAESTARRKTRARSNLRADTATTALACATAPQPEGIPATAHQGSRAQTARVSSRSGKWFPIAPSRLRLRNGHHPRMIPGHLLRRYSPSAATPSLRVGSS